MNPQTLETVATMVLATATIGLALWICLPTFLACIGLAFFDCGGDPDDRHLTETDPLFGKLREQLLELGFVSVGLGWESTIDSPRSRGSSLFCHEAGCYAGIWRLSGGDYRAYITTVFEDGAAVISANYTRPRELTADYHAQGTPTQTMSVLMDQHRDAVASFVKQGHSVQRCTTLDDILQVKKVYFHNPSVQRTYRANKFKVVARRFREVVVFPGVILGLFLYKGQSPLFAWGVACAASFIGAAIHWVEFRQIMAATLQGKTEEQTRADRRRSQNRA